MKINLNNKKFVAEQSTEIKKSGGVVIGNVKTERVFLDIDGNEVVPFTKRIIKKNQP